MQRTTGRVLVLVPEEAMPLLTRLLEESGFRATHVADVGEAALASEALSPDALLAWVDPGDAESVARLRALRCNAGEAALLAVVAPDGAAYAGSLAPFGAQGTIVIGERSDSEALLPLRQAIEAQAAERRRRRLGHGIP